MIRTFEEVKEKALGGPSGALRITSKPPVARVFLNGNLQGVTPLEVKDLPVGAYRIAIKANRYKSIEREVKIVEGKTTKMRGRLRWASKNGGAGKRDASDLNELVQLGLHTADAAKADKVILVDVDSAGKGRVRASAQMVDRRYRAGQPPVFMKAGTAPDERTSALAKMVRTLGSQAGVDLASDPGRHVAPPGVSDPILLGKRKKPIHRRPIFWGAIGAVVVGAIIGGVFAASSGGSAQSGRVKVNFR